MPRCSTHSPTAKMAGSLVRMWSSTRMPRLTSSPLALASAAFGRMPTAITTRSAGDLAAVIEPHARTRSSPRIAWVFGLGEDRDAARFNRLFSR